MDVIAVPGIASLSGPELVALRETAERARVPLDCLAAVISAESGFDPHAVNPANGASGLIQFVDATAKSLGTSTAALRRMSVRAQLPYVARFYARVPRRGTIAECADLYLLTFCPAIVDAPDDELIGIGPTAPLAFDREAPSPCLAKPGGMRLVYEQNAGLDRDGDGLLTVGDVREVMRRYVATYANRPRVPIPESEGEDFPLRYALLLLPLLLKRRGRA